ncbi:hypothetical protein [Streptomyces sp. MJM1172]|uniref:hypothetical protein n=1 Tax=Streptomyces sp. MJM1172 TaxID=1703926 RepID=UPI000A821C63|nr:hypothetical protein [Streptomyces sp. MJM1172]
MTASIEVAETVAQAGHWVVNTYDAVWVDGAMLCDAASATPVCMTCYGVTGLAGPCRG